MDVATEPLVETPVLPSVERPSRRSAYIWGAIFVFFALQVAVVGLESALHFLGPAIDGPFQLYNAVRRIAGGQVGGVDFQFFHGLGIPFVHYPFFRLFGGTFIASEVTRELLSSVAYPLTVIVFLRVFIKDWTRVLAWCAIVMMASITLRMTSVLVAINSLLGIRSTLPVLLPIALALPVRRWVRNAVAALTLGGALIIGTEQGLAALLALALTTAVAVLRSTRWREYLADTAVIIAGGVATLLVLLVVIGGIHGMRGALVYNFRLVPMDQYWYFGAPPNLFLSRWSAIPKMFAALPRIPITLFVGLCAVVFTMTRLWRGANTPSERREFAFALVTLYGLISCASLLGTYVNAYVQPLLRVLLLVGAVYIDEAFVRARAGSRRPLAGIGRSGVIIAVATGVAMIVVVPWVITATIVTMPHFVVTHLIERKGAVFAGIWPATIPAGQAILDSRRGPHGEPPTLWSTYAGLLEARNGIYHPSFDYIIHALGPENRARYLSEFQRLRPRLVQTVDPEYSQYEAWIEGTSWDFYAALLRNYEVIGSTPWSLFWERTATPAPAPQLVWQTAVPSGAQAATLPSPPPAPQLGHYVLAQVELEYRIRNPLRALPIVGSMPRYLVSGTGVLQKHAVTLDPYVTRTSFPLLMIRGATPRLSWQVFSLLPGASIEVRAIKLSVVPTSPKNGVWLAKLIREQSMEMSQ